MIEIENKSDNDVVTWRELRAAIAAMIEFSSQFTVYAAMINSPEEERRAAEISLKARASELEAKYGLDEFSPND